MLITLIALLLALFSSTITGVLCLYVSRLMKDVDHLQSLLGVNEGKQTTSYALGSLSGRLTRMYAAIRRQQGKVRGRDYI